jgi:hypothetical protein
MVKQFLLLSNGSGLEIGGGGTCTDIHNRTDERHVLCVVHDEAIQLGEAVIKQRTLVETAY